MPPEGYIEVTGMSERALAYGKEPLSHRTLVLYEAQGMAGDWASYLIRSLLSEHKIMYEYVRRTKEGALETERLEREGPTGLIVTTTAIALHPENETRMLSLTVTDTREQTAAILAGLADEDDAPDVDFSDWHALYRWLAADPREVTVPFGHQLAAQIPPVAIRLRRDFGTLLALIRAHALLHRATRAQDHKGRIVATVADYAAVRELIAEVVAEGIEATVKPTVRETVEVVHDLMLPGDLAGVPLPKIAARLKLDRATVSRRTNAAADAGYLINKEDRHGKAAMWTIGEPLPEEIDVLPHPDKLDSEGTS